MDSTETEGEMAEDGLWEPLVIIETADITESVSQTRGDCSSVAFDHNCEGKHTVMEEEDKNGDSREASMCSEHHKQQLQATDEESNKEDSKNTDEEQNKCTTQQVGQTHENVNESPEDDGKVAKNQLQVDTEGSAPEQQAKATNSPEEDAKQV